MKAEDAEEFTQALGQIVAGSWRQIALAKRLGVPDALGLSVEAWVNQRLGGYVKMSIAERRDAVRELTDEGLSQREIAAVVGLKKSQVNRDLHNVPNGTTADEWIEENPGDRVPNGTTPLDAVAALAAGERIRQSDTATRTRIENEKRRKDDLQRPTRVAIAPGLHHGDFRELADHIKDNSIDLVFTDPPYNAGAVDLYSDAARIAARILKPGGSFIAYSGQRHLPAVLTTCAVYLDYWWTIAGVHAGGHQILKKLGVRCAWKPLVWFVKDTRGDVNNVLIDVVSGAREKTAHEWQQAEEEARYYIDKLTTASGIVVDFFAGGGTTIAAAKSLGRQCIGFEIDAAAIERATARLNGVAT
jgi:hypothetical protein